MKLSLHATIEPNQWPMDRMQNVLIRLDLRNDGETAIPVYPRVVSLHGLVSTASMGVEWDLVFRPEGKGGQPKIVELRTYYGPPGEPVDEKWMRKTALILKSGESWKSEIHACWVPNALLKPAHLDPTTLDPNGYDNINPQPANPAAGGLGRPPRLAEVIPLARASVLIFNASSVELTPASAMNDDFLRGHLVMFFTEPGPYHLQAVYRQAAFMVPIQAFEVNSQPLPLQIGQ